MSETIDVILIGAEQEADTECVVSQTEESEFLGINYVNAFLQGKGIKCKVFHHAPKLEEIISIPPKIVGFSVMAANYEHAKKYSKEIKNICKNTKIVWGGPQATTYFEEVLIDDVVDYIIYGEGEKSFFELAETLISSKNADNLQGIIYKKGDKIIKNPPRQRLSQKELDSIKPEFIHSADYSKFKKHIPHTVPYSLIRFATICGSRGCWNNCNFCSSNSIWGRNITYRSPQSIVKEIEFLIKEHKVNYIFMSDDDFLINKKWAEEIAKRIMESKVKANLHVMASVRSASSFEKYELLHKAGVREITIGIESTSQQIIDAMGKGYDIQTVPELAEKITSHNIHLGLYYMLGYLGQSAEDLEHDYRFIKKIPFSRIRATFATPYPGTKLFEEVNSKNLWLENCRNNWKALTNDRPVIKTPATPAQLERARQKILYLYFSDEYKKRMKKMLKNDFLGNKAYHEFLDFMRSVL